MSITYLKPKGITTLGPYAPAVEVESGEVSTLYISGQGTYDPSTGEKYLGDDIKRQARIALANLDRVLSGCGYSKNDLVKVNIFAINTDHLAAINNAYTEYFIEAEHLPARTTVIAAGLPGGMAVEFEAIAARPAGARREH